MLICDIFYFFFSCFQATEGSRVYLNPGWGSIRDGGLLFQYSFLTGVLLIFDLPGVVIETGVY